MHDCNDVCNLIMTIIKWAAIFWLVRAAIIVVIHVIATWDD